MVKVVISYHDIFMALTTLCAAFGAAFGGAWVAFRLQKSQNDKKERNHSIVSMQKALFAIGSQYNELMIFYKQHLEKEEKNEIRHILILPIGNYSKIPELDIDSLAFIFGSGDTNIVFELMLAQNSYFSVLGMSEIRNEYHIKFQKLTSDLGSDVVVQLGSEGMMQKYPEIVSSLKQTTDEVYDLYVHAIEKNRKASEMLKAFVSRNFKGVEPIEFIPLENV